MKIKDIFNDHNDWVYGEYRITNKKTGVSLWIANGSFFFTSDNGTLPFGLIERHFLWRHFKNMCKRKALGYDK